MSHHAADRTLPSPICKLSFDRIKAANAIPHGRVRWTLTDVVSWWVSLEQVEPDLLLVTTGLQLPIAEMLAFTVVSLLLPHLFPSQIYCDIVLPNCSARVYKANADIHLLVADIASTRSWSRALTLVKHGDDAYSRRC